MTTHREWTFGTNSVRFEPPDLVLSNYKGTTRLEDARRTIDIYKELGAKQPFFLIVDVTDSSIDKQAREFLTQNVRTEWLLGVVYVGAGLAQKAATKAMSIALYVTGKWSIDFLFANSQQEARAIYERKRAERASKVA
jgi:hypothetical protein